MRILKTAIAIAAGMICHPFMAAAQPAPTPRQGTQLVTLGTAGGPQPRAHRAQSSNLLMVNGTPYIIDAGDGVVRRLAKLKFSYRTIETIFITHGHNDHTAGLGYLLDAAWINQRTEPIHVYGPPETEGLVAAAVQYYGFDSRIRISDGSRTVPIEKIFFGHDVRPGVVFQDANVKVTAVENSHYHFPAGSPAEGKARSYSYRFDTPDRVIVFTGDTGPSDAVADLARGADILVSEVGSPEDAVENRKRIGQWDIMSAKEQQEFIRHQRDEHLTPEAVAAMATRAGVKKVVLTHLTPRPGTDDYGPFAERVRKGFAGEVALAEDLKSF